MSFTFQPLSLPEVIFVTPEIHGDKRGFFTETFKCRDFAEAGIAADFVQDNHSFSTCGVLRGLHWQNQPFSQGKFIRAVGGEIWDVAVDIRPESPTFGKWTGAFLGDKNHAGLWIPPGFAHGFLVLSESVHFIYKCTEVFDHQSEAGFRWNDPAVAINWPFELLPAGITPIISDRDSTLPFLKDVVIR